MESQGEGDNVRKKLSYKNLYLCKKNECENLKKKIKYLLFKINILTNNQNKGEKDEVLLLLDLSNYNEMKQYDELIKIFGEEASSGMSILNLDTNEEIQDINQMSKAPPSYKADCKIRMKQSKNEYCVSIKSKKGANPAILNHTPRSAKVFKENGKLYKYLPALDEILKEYIDKRKKQEIGEDIPITSLECLKNNISLKNDFIDVLEYFTFNGTGKGDSKCKANSIMEYRDDKTTFIKCVNEEQKKEYIESIYENIILSLRDKGMPKILSDYCKPWVFHDIKPDGSIKCKGSLHIRIK